LLTGQPPFAGRPSAAMLAAHVSEAPEAIDRRRPSVPPSLALLVMRSLTNRQADRPQKASEIVRALDDIGTPSGGSAPTSLGMTAAATAGRTPTARVKILAGGVSLAVLAALVVIALMQGRGTPAVPQLPASSAPGLAGLPLSAGGDTAHEFFAQGMTEELTSALTKGQGLQVVSHTLTAATVRRNPDADVRAVGRLLNVAAVLEASVRRAAGRLRVTAQLTNVADGRILWSESYRGDS